MSRAGYHDYDGDEGMAPPAFWWRAVENAAKGKRGQSLLRDLRDALDAMSQKRLIESELRDPNGEVCALGAVGTRRGVDMTPLLRPADCDEDAWRDDWECESVENGEILAKWFNVAPALTREIMYQNDEGGYHAIETPEQRWVRMRKWVAEKLGEKWYPPLSESGDGG